MNVVGVQQMWKREGEKYEKMARAWSASLNAEPCIAYWIALEGRIRIVLARICVVGSDLDTKTCLIPCSCSAEILWSLLDNQEKNRYASLLLTQKVLAAATTTTPTLSALFVQKIRTSIGINYT